jgi:hypothetical protein
LEEITETSGLDLEWKKLASRKVNVSVLAEEAHPPT